MAPTDVIESTIVYDTLTGSPMDESSMDESSMKKERASRPSVLVVEDDEDHCLTMREVLREAGYDVLTASHGREALSLLDERQAPHVIVLDLKLPIMDGWAFMSELRQLPGFRSVPVIVITQAGDHVLSSAPVAAGYLSKPLDQGTFLQTVELCLLRHRR